MNEIKTAEITKAATTMLVQVEQLRKLRKSSIAIDVGVLQDLAFNVLALSQALEQAAQYRTLALELANHVAANRLGYDADTVGWADEVHAIRNEVATADAAGT